MNLDEAKKIEAAATPAPWHARRRRLSLVADDSGMGATLPTNHIGNFAEPGDCTFAAFSRSFVPEAIATIEAQAEEIAALRAARDETCDIAADALGWADRMPGNYAEGIRRRLSELRAIASGKGTK